uniref:Photosystem I P700 chlorophyll a apoprotein A2 n=1 Tax=Haematococcus lacustris TaxID=44745 RepID=A0A2K9YS29_HAELA|nr:photosystem I P700 chlorophyll a apoprotein A2 [Haematococcus lacustris]AUW36538.1 photosystem I P700 chlorophyll a apoprotein A2 [Haematococcus lacustris]
MEKTVSYFLFGPRFVGLAHFIVGYIFTYAAFLIASTSSWTFWIDLLK